MKNVKLLVYALLLSLVATTSFAEPPVPDAGIRAEMDKRWQDAIEIYQQSLVASPQQPHLWKRISDIEAHLGNSIAAADALENATKLAPNDANLFYLLAQARANANQPQKALAASRRAVELEPENVEYLDGRAMHANWLQDHETALDSYQRILNIHPDDDNALLGMARTYSWMEDYESASSSYEKYVSRQQQDKVAMMEYIEVEAELGRYESAARLGDLYRERFGEDLEYWLAVSDLYALSGNDEAAAMAIEKATRYASDDPAMFYRLAQSFTSIESADRALKAIKHALSLDPENLEYYRTQAELAAWRANYPLALESYQEILKRVPDDSGALLGTARVHYWMANTDEAIKSYQEYLHKHPHIQVIWIEYIQVQTEIGNYNEALAILEEYKERFGDNNNYKRQKAQILAWASRPRAALAITTPLLEELPDDYVLNNTHTIALRNNHQPAEAVASLSELYRIDPENEGYKSTYRYVKTPLRSNIRLHGNYQTDTDDIDIRRLGIKGTYVHNPKLRFWLAGERHTIKAPIGSGFETVGGSSAIDYTTGTLGARYNHSASLAVEAEAGSGDVESANSHSIYRIAADIWPRDALSLRLSRQQDIYAVSPRATSLEIMRKANQLDVTWQPNFLYTVDAMVVDASFSDSNSRWDLAVSPRRSIIRRQHFQLDIGVGAHWFAYDKTLNNGYYSPTDYERYSLNAFAAWWFNENNGINVSVSIGPYKDNTMSSSRSAGDITLEGIIGAYREWMLEARTSFSQNTGINTGAYRSHFYELVLTRRF